MYTSVILLLGVLCLSSCEIGYLPPYIEPCLWTDPNFAECVRKEIVKTLPLFTKGIPELGVPPMEPFRLDDIKIEGNGLNLVFNDAYLHDISKLQVTDLKVDIADEKFALAFKANVSLTGKYTIDGRLLILSIKGHGDAIVICENLDVSITSKMAHVKDNNGEHLKLTSPSYNYNFGKATFEFKNLFNGNKALSDATHTFANNNWRQIMDDLAPPVVKQIVRTGVKSINKFFAGVTISQIIKGYPGN